MAELLDIAKTAIRVKSTAYDDNEIQPLIDACLLDLGLAGIKKIDKPDALVKQAVRLYVKANFGYDEDSEKFLKAYEALKVSMALSGDYKCITV